MFNNDETSSVPALSKTGTEDVSKEACKATANSLEPISNNYTTGYEVPKSHSGIASTADLFKSEAPVTRRCDMWANIPQELRDCNQWICWRYENRDGKLTKVPYNPTTEHPASTTDPSSWCSFEVVAHLSDASGYDGIGFVFNEDDPFMGVDLDHVLDDEGHINPKYEELVRSSDTYTEISPSGHGLHLVCLGKKPEGLTACKHTQPDGSAVEVYDHARYFTMTGNVYVDEGGHAYNRLSDGGEGRDRILQLLQPEDGAKSSNESHSCNEALDPLPDEEVLRALFGGPKGAENKALYEGDISAYNYDDSSADMALCDKLAYYTCHNREQMDRLFRRSNLMRPKWDERRGERTYGERTIDRALESMRWDHRPDERGKWYVDEDGALRKRNKDGDYVLVTATAPQILADYVDIDTGEVRNLIGFMAGGAFREVVVTRPRLLNTRTIVDELAPAGANISSANARDIVAYLTDLDAQPDRREKRRCVSRLGWIEPLGHFMPYDEGVDGLMLDARTGDVDAAAPFASPKGGLGEWVDFMRPLREASEAFRFMLAVSCASVLVAVLGLQSCIVHFWGNSRSGKTAALKAAASIWGNPTEAGGYLRNYSDTPKSLIKSAARLRNLPLPIDELQAKGSFNQRGKQSAAEDLIYELSLGREQGALNRDRTLKSSESWANLTMSTGEIPITTSSTQQGARNRTLDVRAEPFDDVGTGKKVHNFVADHYGVAGRAFIKAVQGYDIETLRQRFEKIRCWFAKHFSEYPQTDILALCALADAIASEAIFSDEPKDWDDLALEGVENAWWVLENSTSPDELDTDRQAIQTLDDWIAANRASFTEDAIHCLGCFEPDEQGSDESAAGKVFIIGNEFQKALEAEGFDYRKTLDAMKEAKIRITDNNGLNPQKDVNGDGHRLRCIGVDLAKLRAYLDGDTDQ